MFLWRNKQNYPLIITKYLVCSTANGFNNPDYTINTEVAAKALKPVFTLKNRQFSIDTEVVADKRCTVEDFVVPVARVHSFAAVTAPQVRRSVVADSTGAFAASAAVEVTSVVSFAAVAAGAGGWGFSASCCCHPGDLRGLGPSGCKSP